MWIAVGVAIASVLLFRRVTKQKKTPARPNPRWRLEREFEAGPARKVFVSSRSVRSNMSRGTSFRTCLVEDEYGEIWSFDRVEIAGSTVLDFDRSRKQGAVSISTTSAISGHVDVHGTPHTKERKSAINDYFEPAGCFWALLIIAGGLI